MNGSGHVLTVVIPALDEEQAIGATLERCLSARDAITGSGGVERVEIVVVSDGSRDRTEAIACGFEDVTVLGFDRNRGYGAAIQSGFAHGSGDLLAFMDADGTCDPANFAILCRAIDEQQADVVLGSRMGEGSAMPMVRAIGNALFAWILGILARQRIRDTASGMRVLRRAALADLNPLPDGLHFTPAMTARILLEGKLHLVELPVPYAERVGQSKLHVMRDGVRFLTCIVQTAVTHRPARPLLLAGSAAVLCSALVGGMPVLYYLTHRRLEEWMIYRLLLASLLTTVASLCVATAVVAERMAALAHGRLRRDAGPTGLASRIFRSRHGWVLGLGAVGLAVLVVWPGIAEYWSSGQVTMHWSRAALASLLVVLAVASATAAFLLDMLDLIERERAGLSHLRAPDRVRRARAVAR
ncbi:MAG TPA: glycosyltransferase family 2 protein [Myxococcota bacterium]|nr:glycosyltransferase family 2 protein [Myxococcota bacterium]